MNFVSDFMPGCPASKFQFVGKISFGILRNIWSKSSSHVVTFNYDDIIDQKLWEVHRLTTTPGTGIPYWHPDGRYWFFCRPASLTVEERNVFMDRASMHLLKLHGSPNWRVRRGAPSISPVDSICILRTGCRTNLVPNSANGPQHRQTLSFTWNQSLFGFRQCF